MYPCKIEAVALFDSTRELNMLFLSDPGNRSFFCHVLDCCNVFSSAICVITVLRKSKMLIDMSRCEPLSYLKVFESVQLSVVRIQFIFRNSCGPMKFELSNDF